MWAESIERRRILWYGVVIVRVVVPAVQSVVLRVLDALVAGSRVLAGAIFHRAHETGLALGAFVALLREWVVRHRFLLPIR